MRVTLSPAADRDVSSLSPRSAERVFAALRALREDPRPAGCRLLRHQTSRTWRVRVGNWRVLYDIDDTAEVVTILRVLHRREAYR